MKISSTSQRLKQLMKDENYRQVDILNKCLPYCKKYNVKLGRNDLSQYVNGKVEPGQEKLSILGLALNVNEAWLMGYDVPIDRENTKETTNSGYEALVIKEMSKMNKNGKIKLLSTAKEMNCSPLYNDNYQEVLAAAHERTDIEVTEEMRKHDDAIMMDDSFWE